MYLNVVYISMKNIMNIKTKQLLTLVLCLSLLFSLVGCSFTGEDFKHVEQIDSTVASTTEDIPASDTANEAFNAFLEDYFTESVTSDSITLHYTLKDPSAYGISLAEPIWSTHDINDFDYYTEDLNADYANLTSFDYTTLDKDQQQIYDIMNWDMSLDLSTTGLEYYSDIFSGSSSFQSSIPTTMAEYQFYTPSDVDNYLSLLNSLPAYIDTLCTFEQNKSAAGLFMSDTSADNAITQCTDFIAHVDDNLLITTFDTRIDAMDSLTDEEKAAYKTANITAVKESVIPAYEAIIDILTNLKGTGVNDGGICNFDQGKEYYEYLVKSGTGSDKTIEELTTMIEDSFESSLTDMYSVYSNNPDAYDYFYSGDDLYTNSDPTEILNTLKTATTEDFPTPPEVSFSIKYVDKSLEDSVSPAFYMTPPIDDVTNNVIYINNSEENGNSDLFSTLAHEGYPGHMYQITSFYASNPNPVRCLYSFLGYCEGWATYAEVKAYDYADYVKYPEDIATISKASDILSLTLSSRIDIGVNYEGWKLTDVEDYLTQSGYDASYGADIYQYVIENPSVYLRYCIGYLEIAQLETNAKTALGDAFNQKEFNAVLINAGPCQFNLVNTYVNDYIDSKKNQ